MGRVAAAVRQCSEGMRPCVRLASMHMLMKLATLSATKVPLGQSVLLGILSFSRNVPSK